MNRRCLNCMKEFMVLEGYENEDNCCPFCGFVENTPPENQNYLRTGTLLNNRYTVGTVIGSGGFGITYKAWDNTFEGIVAIKEYFPRGLVSRSESTTLSTYAGEETSFQHGKDRFLKEARNLEKFNKNPRIVSVLDYFEANGTAYLVMEYLNGCTLKEYVLLTGGVLPLDMVMMMSETMCDVLSEIHAVGMVHRDISPDNIFICQDFSYKLIDFGSSKLSATDTELSSTILLKHGYAPVEQYSKSGKVGPWTDIYALAATIYKLSTGKLPQEAIDRISSDTLVPPNAINGEIPKNFSDAIMKGLSVQVGDRYQNAADFKRDLLKVVSEENTSAQNISTGDNSYVVSDVIGAGGEVQLLENDIINIINKDLYSKVSAETLDHIYNYALQLFNHVNRTTHMPKRYNISNENVVLSEDAKTRKNETNLYLGNLIIDYLVKRRYPPAVNEFGRVYEFNMSYNDGSYQSNGGGYQGARPASLAVHDVNEYRAARDRMRAEEEQMNEEDGEEDPSDDDGIRNFVIGMGVFFIILILLAAIAQ